MANEETKSGKPKGYGYLMAGGVFFGGYVAYLLAKAGKLEKPMLAIAVAGGLLVGAMISGQVLKKLDEKPETTTAG